MKKFITGSEDMQDNEDLLKDSLSTLKDDFDYIVAGIERAGRQGKYSEVMLILTDIEESFDAAISNISDLQEV
jgi:hypothetical protein